MSGGEGFLSRWSRRKLTPAPEADVVAPETTSVTLPEDAASPPAEEPEFDLTTLTPLEALTSESDFTQFLQRGVPETLRNAALRKMWVLDPVLSAPDRFAEYAWDFNDPGAMPGFGPMEAGFDPSTMLRRIMGEPDPEAPADEALAELPAPNQEEPLPPEPETDALPEPPLAGQIVAIPGIPGEESMVAREIPEETLETIAPRRRHGGALPN